MDDLDTFVAEDKLGKVRIDEGTYDKGIYIWVKELREEYSGSISMRTAAIDLTREQAEDLFAWLYLYLYPDSPNPQNILNEEL